MPKKQQCNVVISICGGNTAVVVAVATLAGTGAAVLGREVAGLSARLSGASKGLGCAAGQNRFCPAST